MGNRAHSVLVGPPRGGTLAPLGRDVRTPNGGPGANARMYRVVRMPYFHVTRRALKGSCTTVWLVALGSAGSRPPKRPQELDEPLTRTVLVYTGPASPGGHSAFGSGGDRSLPLAGGPARCTRRVGPKSLRAKRGPARAARRGSSRRSRSLREQSERSPRRRRSLRERSERSYRPQAGPTSPASSAAQFAPSGRSCGAPARAM
jgi:hypothetical protein